MFEVRFSPSAARACIVTACLAMLAGCGGGSGGSTDSAPTTGGNPTQNQAPSAPTNLAATAGNAQVALTWTASSGATSYHVKRATVSGGPYTQLNAPTSASYTDSSLTNGTTYYYVVSAVNANGESANSSEANAAPSAPPPTAAPTVPASVVATAGDSIVNLTWAASSGATSYHVKRGTSNGGPYTQVGAPTSASYSDSTVTNGNSYFYVVSAVNSAGESANSAQVSAGPAAASSNPPPTTFGTWINVTPSAVDLVNGACGNYGIETIQADHANPSNIYFHAHCQGIWKSTDFGATWGTSPINTGTHAAETTNCAGGMTIWPNSTAATPTLFLSCIRGNPGPGFWKSVDGGVNWTQYNVAPSGSRQDYYPPVVDPYDGNHLLMAGHEMNYIVESVDGGQTWTNVTMDNGMLQTGGTGELFFIDTGNPTTTRTTWLWLAQITGGNIGTWRTETGGASPTWTKVDKNEHPHGAAQIYQPDSHGVVYMGGLYSAGGWGIQRSTDYGKTWTHVGSNTNETVVVGTSKNIYSMFGWSIGPPPNTDDPVLQVAAQPGTGAWSMPGTPASMTQGPHYISVLNDGTHNVLVGAMGNGGVWRYVEP
jgi:hypothetical protein